MFDILVIKSVSYKILKGKNKSKIFDAIILFRILLSGDSVYSKLTIFGHIEILTMEDSVALFQHNLIGTVFVDKLS